MQSSQPPALSAQKLACRRGDRLLFRGLSFDLKAGEALHVTGANGSGKTTLIRALAGLTTPYAGEVSSSGDIGLLDDRTALDPDLPLTKALEFWDKIDQFGDPNVGPMESMGLASLLDVPVRYLSTGQKKRAAMAVLMHSDSSIWLLDEPLSGLDAAAINRVTALIQNHLSNDGIAVIASHQTLAIEGLRSLAIEDFAPRDEAK